VVPDLAMKSISMDASWSPVPPSRVTIVDGFWKRWRDLIGTTTLFHQFRQLQGEGQIDALALDQKMHRGRAAGDDWYWGGSIFWDSDLAKWLEAASARLQQTKDPELEKLVDDIIGRFERAQQPDGYVNSHILTWRPRHRFKNLRDLHELYCAGHLIEAAVVHHEATGKDTLLSVARRYADLLFERFGKGPGKMNGYCGHPEIELALMRLYRLTGEIRYLELSRFFIDERGASPNYFEREAIDRLDKREFRPNHPGSPYAYMQAHEPIRQQTKVVGHAVRAMYLLSAVVDVGVVTKDASLLEAAERLWRDVIDTKLYLTGGIGSASENEGFTGDYDLPNEKAYAETCASIGLFLFGHRLLQTRLDSEFSDVMESALYNCILSGIGLDGESFFYDNPLASRGAHHRIPWPWWCPCCPPNLARLISSLSGYLLSEGPDGIAIHQYVSCEASFPDVRLTIKSGLPFVGHTAVEIATGGPIDKTLALRLPGWAGKIAINVNDQPQNVEGQNGYVYLRRVWNNGDRIELNAEMPVRQKFARFDVEADRGRTALTRGPLVYCIEQVDNGPDLDRLVLPAQTEFHPAVANDLLGGVTVLKGRALRETDSTDKLYTEDAPVTEPVELCAIPYYAWANREPGEMQVWMRHSV
jgi:uncharacterized protein